MTLTSRNGHKWFDITTQKYKYLEPWWVEDKSLELLQINEGCKQLFSPFKSQAIFSLWNANIKMELSLSQFQTEIFHFFFL